MLLICVWFCNLQANIDRLQAKIHEYSQHSKLVKITSRTLGSLLYLTLIMDTGDAAGQNMVTNATWNCCKWVIEISKKELGVTVKHFYVATVSSGEKSNSSVNLLNSRGVHVVAEAWLPESVIKSTLKVHSVPL